jgi:hypothetical protein
MTLPDVILLNGTTSAGKSQLTLALQARLPFVRIGIDDFIWERVPASWFVAVERFLGGPRDDGTGVEFDSEPPKLWRPTIAPFAPAWPKDWVWSWTTQSSRARCSMIGWWR